MNHKTFVEISDTLFPCAGTSAGLFIRQCQRRHADHQVTSACRTLLLFKVARHAAITIPNREQTARCSSNRRLPKQHRDLFKMWWLAVNRKGITRGICGECSTWSRCFNQRYLNLLSAMHELARQERRSKRRIEPRRLSFTRAVSGRFRYAACDKVRDRCNPTSFAK